MTLTKNSSKRQKVTTRSHPSKKSSSTRASEYPNDCLTGGKNDKIYCNVCKSHFANHKDTTDKHIKGPRHQKAIEEAKFHQESQKSLTAFFTSKNNNPLKRVVVEEDQLMM